MKKILLAVVALAVLGLIVFFATANKNETNTTSDSNTQSSSQNNNQSSSGAQTSSLKDLVARGSQQCTYKDGQNEGVVYTSNGKARMDFTSVTNGVSTGVHSIIDGSTYYSWVDGQPSGFKFSINQSSTGSVGSNQNVDLDKQINYNCSGWSADSSKFNLPTGVQFTDFSSLQMQGGN